MKSFSEFTKEELFNIKNESSCCDISEFVGMLLFGASISTKEIKLVTENHDVLEKYTYLARKLGFDAEVNQSSDKSARYTAVIYDRTTILTILNDFGLIDMATGLMRYKIADFITENDCCRHSFIRGAFMSGGTVIDPNKNYNLEIITPYMGLCNDFISLLSDEGFNFKLVTRKSKYVIYTKSSENIEDFLTYIGAYKAQMELINIKIEKEIRNDFNRSINSENANLEKTIDASVRQIQAIDLISEKIGLDELPSELKELAVLRLAHKSMSLQELGKQLSPPLGKSGVNHRFQKIISIAEKLA